MEEPIIVEVIIITITGTSASSLSSQQEEDVLNILTKTRNEIIRPIIIVDRIGLFLRFTIILAEMNVNDTVRAKNIGIIKIKFRVDASTKLRPRTQLQATAVSSRAKTKIEMVKAVRICILI